MKFRRVIAPLCLTSLLFHACDNVDPDDFSNAQYLNVNIDCDQSFIIDKVELGAGEGEIQIEYQNELISLVTYSGSDSGYRLPYSDEYTYDDDGMLMQIKRSSVKNPFTLVFSRNESKQVTRVTATRLVAKIVNGNITEVDEIESIQEIQYDSDGLPERVLFKYVDEDNNEQLFQFAFTTFDDEGNLLEETVHLVETKGQIVETTIFSYEYSNHNNPFKVSPNNKLFGGLLPLAQSRFSKPAVLHGIPLVDWYWGQASGISVQNTGFQSPKVLEGLHVTTFTTDNSALKSPRGGWQYQLNNCGAPGIVTHIRNGGIDQIIKIRYRN